MTIAAMECSAIRSRDGGHAIGSLAVSEQLELDIVRSRGGNSFAAGRS
jgi:hypothetical protein